MTKTFENLTPELQEKLKACKTPEELAALAKENGFELADEELENLAGGTPSPIRTPPCPAKILDASGKKFKKSSYLQNQQTTSKPADE